MYLTRIELSHFFSAEAYHQVFDSFAVVKPGLTTYYLLRGEAEKRGCAEQFQSMWTVYAVK